MKLSRIDASYPKDKVGELEKYKRKLLEGEEAEDHGVPGDALDEYKSDIVENRILQVKKQEAVSPILKKLVVSEQADEITPLRMIGSGVMGGLFDRVRFLKERISETVTFMDDRKRMNELFNKDSDEDIAEMERILPGIADREELREFKINLNLLKMEKRKENNLFWRDMLALKIQLRELKEQFEVESKIADLFGDLSG